MLRRENIREGKWVLAVEFGIGAINASDPGTTEVRPAAVVPIINIAFSGTINQNSRISRLTLRRFLGRAPSVAAEPDKTGRVPLEKRPIQAEWS